MHEMLAIAVPLSLFLVTTRVPPAAADTGYVYPRGVWMGGKSYTSFCEDATYYSSFLPYTSPRTCCFLLGVTWKCEASFDEFINGSPACTKWLMESAPPF
ncbi:hypothetical protein M427DRAFT_30312 [Gonapodya prolifera JEL478]|uniref:Secreted protein n=1 Tax=Gonapodya prolifera (strain JEL478) TaxID=1344416 RepID=A0A139ALP8_GONPJ|nr:hypothetical protein M427DRAFT_30312 [Gonapodya prolifera JEL478]|eukprot:KXS17484.1 hypothetical protein M427DRAFT_30312 [Gonapodya prolifera JEL478]